MEKEINNNGYDYVDLGLPSSTLWATCNVGASKSSESGLYFQWGDTKGYTKEQVGKGKKFKWDDYKWNASKGFSKYKTPGASLRKSDDAAHANMGGSWHMPTPDQIKELTTNTTSTWTKQDGVNGKLFTSNNDTSKSIFFPALGYALDCSVHDSGGSGDIWSSMLDTRDVSFGQFLDFDSGCAGLYNGSRCCGFSVRGVIG